MTHDFETLVGLGAGVATSALFMMTALCFTAAGRRIGSTVVNATRIYLAIGMLALTHRLLAGVWLPDAAGPQIAYLAASGVVGLALGDHALFTAFVDIGPRLAILIMTTAPLFAVGFGWAVLGETLHGVAWLGVLLTLAGVAWVVLERQPAGAQRSSPHFARGVFLAFVGAACQAGGLLLSKQGMGHGWLPPDQRLSPQAATLVRMVFAGLATLPMLAVYLRMRGPGSRPGRSAAGANRSEWRSGLVYTGLGAVVGPFLGVWMSLVASDRVPLGIAQTLCSLTPIFILPAVVVVYGERVSLRAAIGAGVAVLGAVLLFVEPS